MAREPGQAERGEQENLHLVHKALRYHVAALARLTGFFFCLSMTNHLYHILGNGLELDSNEHTEGKSRVAILPEGSYNNYKLPSWQHRGRRNVLVLMNYIQYLSGLSADLLSGSPFERENRTQDFLILKIIEAIVNTSSCLL